MPARYVVSDTILIDLIDVNTVLIRCRDDAKSIPGGVTVMQEIRMPLVMLKQFSHCVQLAAQDWRTLVGPPWRFPKE